MRYIWRMSDIQQSVLEREIRRIISDVLRMELEKLLTERIPDIPLLPPMSMVGRAAGMAGIDPDFTDAEVAELWRVGARTIARLRKSGRLGFYRYANRTRIGASHIRKFQEECEVMPRARRRRS